MSAIFGKFTFDGRPVAPETLDAMRLAMAHWGKDGEGSWCEGGVGLGHLHRNNSPESVGEHLPWQCPDSGDVITAIAHLDNRETLFRELSIPREQQADLPDSRLVLRAYQRWGEACAERLLGDWACAIWDHGRRKLFIARDHHGNMGLYYTRDERRLLFASSLKGLLTLPKVPQRPNPLTIAHVLVSWPIQGEQTCYEGILRLPPAHTLSVTAGGIEVSRYWYLEHTPDLHLPSDQDYVEAFLETYAEAVRCRLGCSEPVGTTLSGGLDSGSVAVLAAAELKKRGQRLPAFSSVPATDTKDRDNMRFFGDESPYINATAASAGNIDVHWVRAEDVSPVQGIERALEIHDQPLHGAANMHWVTTLWAEAAASGLGALLTGAGGNATVSWRGRGGVELPLIQQLLRRQWRAIARQALTPRQVTPAGLWGAVKRQIIHPLFDTTPRFTVPREPWRDRPAGCRSRVPGTGFRSRLQSRSPSGSIYPIPHRHWPAGWPQGAHALHGSTG